MTSRRLFHGASHDTARPSSVAASGRTFVLRRAAAVRFARPVTPSQLLLALGIGSCVGLGVAVGAHAVLPESPVVRGHSIGGARVPVTGSVATWLAARDAEVRARPVHFHVDDRVFDATFGEAGVSLDVAATMQAAEAVAHTGSFSARMSATRAARRGGSTCRSCTASTRPPPRRRSRPSPGAREGAGHCDD